MTSIDIYGFILSQPAFVLLLIFVVTECDRDTKPVVFNPERKEVNLKEYFPPLEDIEVYAGTIQDSHRLYSSEFIENEGVEFYQLDIARYGPNRNVSPYGITNPFVSPPQYSLPVRPSPLTWIPAKT